MKFTLNIDGEQKTFTVLFVKGRNLRRALKVNKILNNKTDVDEETLDILLDFVCETFDNQFTQDDILDGLELKDVFPALRKVLIDVITEATSGISGVSNSKNQ